LDDILGGSPIEYREVEGEESKKFLDLFKNGIDILNGGIDTGFNVFEPESFIPKLLQVKGKQVNKIKIFEVEKTSNSLNEGDPFILVSKKIKKRIQEK
jgi:hypothetical protein